MRRHARGQLWAHAREPSRHCARARVTRDPSVGITWCESSRIRGEITSRCGAGGRRCGPLCPAFAHREHGRAQLLLADGLVQDALLLVLAHENGRVATDDDERNALLRKQRLQLAAVAVCKNEIEDRGIYPMLL